MAALNSESFVIEGNSLVFTFTLDTAVSTTTSYNWKVVPQGTFPALSSDFTSLTGTVSFAAGESEKTITITTTENTAGAVDRSFMLEIRDSSDNLVVTSEIITLEEDDDRVIEFLGSVESDVLGAATSFDISRMDGFGGDDYYIITQYQQGDVSISDDVGTNVIKFDYGVEITDFSETSRFGGRQVASFTVTLKSGAEISVASPKGTFSYQIGDGEVLDYDAFKAAIDAFGTNSESTLAEPFTVETSTPSPDLTSDTESVPLIEILGGDDGDVLGAATSLEISRMSGFGGNDYYIITQYQQGDVSISDDAGANVIKFDYGVEITGFSETSRFGGRQVAHFTVTLESGAEINVASPKGTLSYQIGNGGVLDYDAFKAAIGASGTNDGSALANSFPVLFPAVIDNHGPVFTSLGSVSVTEDIGEDVTIYTATAADADGDTVTYSITSGNDAGVFKIDASTGVVSLVSGQSLDAEGTSSYALTITASSQASGETAKAETLDVTITVDSVDEGDAEFRIVSSGNIDAAMEGDVLVVYLIKPDPDGDGAFTYQWQRDGSDIAGATAVIYTVQDVDEGTSLTITVSYTDGDGTSESVISSPVTVSVPVNNIATAIAVGAGAVTEIAENANTNTRTKIADLVVTDDDGGNAGTLELTGTNAALFVLEGTELYLVAGANLDHETVSTLDVRVQLNEDNTVGVDVSLAVTNVDEIATALALADGAVTEIAENVDTNTRMKIANLIVTDDDGGDAGTLELTGTNAALFVLEGTELYLVAGANLDHEGTPTLDVRVQLEEDDSIGVDVLVTVTNVDEGDATIVIDDATIVIDDADSGTAEHITDASGLAVGSRLFARLSDGDPNGNGNASYQWQRDGSDIAGATGEVYTVQDSDFGQALTVTVSYGGGTDEGVTSDAVNLPATPVSTALILLGSTNGNFNAAAAGDWLIAYNLEPDPDGSDDDAFTYQWQRDGVDIAGRRARNSLYKIVDADEGTTLTVIVRYTDGKGVNKIATVTATELYVPVPTDYIATALALADGAVTEIIENVDTSSRIKIADLDITDVGGDSPGTLELVGTNDDLFELIGTELYLVAGANLDYETTPALSVRVQLFEDTTIGVDVLLAVTDDGVAEFEITSNGDINAVAERDVLSVALKTSDPDGNGDGIYTYQWKRGGGDIAGATEASYSVTAADLGRALTVTVSYTDSGGSDERDTTDAVDIPAAPLSANQASFIITSDGDTSAPAVGNELRVALGTDDPDGNGRPSYQWFVVGGHDIAGATEATYTITKVGQIIGVRVSYTDGGGFDETVTTQLSVASVLVDPDAYTLFQHTTPYDTNYLDGILADELIQGGNHADIISTGGGDDIVIGGYGSDRITLSDDGAETIVYRFSSERSTDKADKVGWIAIDGADTVTDFDRGTDKLVFVDVDTSTPVDFAGFFADRGSFNVNPVFDSNDNNVLIGVIFQFIGAGLTTGPENGGNEIGRWLKIYYKNEDKVTVYNDDGSTTEEGVKFVGEDGASLDTTSDTRASRHYLTDLSLLPNYFGEDFADGFQVIAPNELGVDII